MKSTKKHDERIAKMTFSSVYPHYVTKVEKKGRTKEELQQIIEWLTGYDEKKLQEVIEEKVTFEKFFQDSKLNPNAYLITGVICGYRVCVTRQLLKYRRTSNRSLSHCKTAHQVTRFLCIREFTSIDWYFPFTMLC